jgi:hypothetical protein
VHDDVFLYIDIRLTIWYIISGGCMNNPYIHYYLTDRSYAYLVHTAQKQGYVEFGAKRVRGMSDFLNDLALCEFEDTRPDLVKRRHNEERTFNRAPTWMNVRQRRARSLQLNPPAVDRYFLVALQMGIIEVEPFAVGGPARNTPYPSIAIVLEAIGLQWITPNMWPSKYNE